ncbi:MAG: efflux RND transporter periplasmic adaptor subunit [Gammaproteobacteria bacterium]|nr:efflux RND transporter periplasmic adaptor subunit [Gammaproteobacteria bacterium]MDH4315819.1 efflux RND transporter periplasmic adaptor subunit [Gammaproteobacteria bacterium]MDH5215253.1 efflux RND transporter periplasmic adaptor subunit [Gammaproteobacteria bacterium]
MLIPRIIAVSLCAASTLASAQGGFPTTVETAQVRATTMESSVKAVGTLLAEASAELRAEGPGQIVKIHFAEGQRVKTGDPLFSIEATVLEAEVNEARANAERSTAAFERAREMYSKKLISANDYDAAQANMNVDTARLLSSQAKLYKTVIRAPFDGYVGLRKINVGDYATTGQAVVDVVQLDPLRVEFSLPETLFPKIKAGQPVEVSTDAYPGETFGGTITAVSPRIDVAGHSVAVRASLPNGELKLRPGFFVRVNVTLAQKENALLVPEEAIWPVGHDKTVYVVVDGKAEQRVVRIGERLPGQVEVLSGLEVGDTIVTAGQMKLFEGADVQSKGAATTATN